jgi:hypothetical protein
MEKMRGPRFETEKKSEVHDPNFARSLVVQLRTSGFDLLSVFGSRVSDFSLGLLINNANHHPPHGAFVSSDRFASGGAVGGDHHSFMQSRTVGIDGHLGNTFWRACLADGLANQQSPPLKARVLSGCHQVAFDTREQHKAVRQ